MEPPFRIFVILAMIALSCAHQKPVALMSYEQYNEISASIQPPYILNLYTAKGSLLYFGAEHTINIDHQQFAQLEDLWNKYQPTFAFSEGGLWPVEKSREE